MLVNYLRRSAVLLLMVNLFACTAVQPYEYAALQAASPRSILIMPPMNNSTEVLAGPLYMSTLSEPLGERGYYVFPVAVVERYFRENGLPGPAEMNTVTLEKLGEQFNADAVLYAMIHDWGQKYRLLSSVSVVKVDLKLVDIKTGTLLWETNVFHERGSGDGGGGPLGAVIGALVTQLLAEAMDPMYGVSSGANTISLLGLLSGPYYPTEQKQ